MEAVDLFYSYAHEDEALRDELAGHLKIMERRGVIRPWHDRRIDPGTRWDREIDRQLARADLVLLLVSKDFINSDYIWGHELDTAMRRQRSGEASVVPVMLRAVDIAGAPFAELQGLPSDLRPVTSWPNRDEAWTDVAKGIRRTVEQIRSRASAPVPASPLSVFGDSGEQEARAGTTAGAGDDPLLERVLDGFSTRLVEAARARGNMNPDTVRARGVARALIDTPAQKRLLWVDDRPANNRRESAALARLQIEIVAVTSTSAALQRIADDPEPFDLVLSDWERPEPHDGAPSAGIGLLRRLRERDPGIPVVFYHGSISDPAKRRARHDLALREGAFGEAVLPHELLTLVATALGAR